MSKRVNFLLILLTAISLFSCKTRKYPERASVVIVDTVLSGIHFSSSFPAARMNTLNRENDSTFIIGISPENKPINPSPWYAFKIWSSKAVPVTIKLKYDGAGHRYQPKITTDGLHYADIDEVMVNKNKSEAKFMLTVNTVPVTVAAQEIIDSKMTYQWIDSLAGQRFIKKKEIGKSVMGKPVIALHTTGSNGKKAVVVLSRQHPPEVSGYLAMQEFVRVVTSQMPLAVRFRAQYKIFIIPMINPDGVDEGNWRHSRNGVDLNRDWKEFNQPETRAVRDYLLKTLSSQKAKVYFGLDFHSTFYDVFYTNETNPAEPTHMPGFTDAWIKEFEKAIPGFKANVKPSGNVGNVSKSWMGKVLQAEAVTYEVGDDTPKAYVKLKAKVAAEKMMELLLK